MISKQHSLLFLLLAFANTFHSGVAWAPAALSTTSRVAPSTSTAETIIRMKKGVDSPQQTSLRHRCDSQIFMSAVEAEVVTIEQNKLALPPKKEEEPTKEEGELELKDKIINAVFLSAAFGYALYTIFSIDQGITRGWTGSEIAMRIPLDNWGAYESYLANKPIVTKTLINVIIYLLGDWLSQTVFQKKNILEFDIKRTFRNGFIGLCFGPLVHEYYQFSDSILPPEDGLVTRLEKILMDQTIYLTVKCSIYISAVGLLSGNDWETVQQTVKDKIGGIVITAWKFWPLVHCITYGLIPARHRILWVNSVDLVWNAILASMASKAQKDAPEIDEAALVEEFMGIEPVSTSGDGNDHHHSGNQTFSFGHGDVHVVQEPFLETNQSSNSTTTAPIAI